MISIICRAKSAVVPLLAASAVAGSVVAVTVARNQAPDTAGSEQALDQLGARPGAETGPQDDPAPESYLGQLHSCIAREGARHGVKVERLEDGGYAVAAPPNSDALLDQLRVDCSNELGVDRKSRPEGDGPKPTASPAR